MTLVSSRVSLIQRCVIERDASIGGAPDAWGHPQAPNWQTHLADVPCRSWVDAGREVVNEDRSVVVIDRRLVLPASTDVTERDRIVSVTERGAELLDGPMGVEAVLRRGNDHLELVLTRLR